jgi:hypothetical protein
MMEVQQSVQEAFMNVASPAGRFGLQSFMQSLLSPAVHLIIIAAVTVPIVIMFTTGEAHPSGAFFVFAALPSVVGLLHHVGRERRRFEEGKADLEMRGGKTAAIERFQPTAWSMLTSCLTLYAIFLVCAMLAAAVTATPLKDDNAGALRALVLAGYGAYVSVLWYMLARSTRTRSPRASSSTARCAWPRRWSSVTWPAI